VSDYVGVSYEVAGEYNPPLFPCSHGDPGGGMLSAAGILLALLEQRRTGRPVVVESPQLNSTLSHLAHVVRRADGEVLGRCGLDPLQMGTDALDRLYPTADGWLCIAAHRDDEIRNLGGALGIDLPGTDRFATPEARKEHRYELETLVEDALAGATAAEWQEKLAAAGVPAGVPQPGLTPLFHDPAARRRRQVAEVTHERWGTVREVDTLIRVSGTRPVPHRLAPALGEHTDEVLAELGYDADRIATLRAGAVVR
jgi:crotonobetainyl-CoA:carnitine CoA-transferase CaiB-like acyl-CoA transferase